MRRFAGAKRLMAHDEPRSEMNYATSAIAAGERAHAITRSVSA